MKKSITLTLLLASCGVHAGTMGPVATPSSQFFVSAEGGYTWNQLDGANFNVSPGFDIYTITDNQGGTARVAAGVIHPLMNNALAVSAELGWGYYGHTRFKFAAPGLSAAAVANLNNAIKVTTYLNGFDVLAGLIYNINPQFDVFAKAGALIENNRTTLNLDASVLGASSRLIIRTNEAQALPAIKLGGSYHVMENLSLFASWTHAFGDNNDTSGLTSSATIQGLLDSANLSVNQRNPTLDVAMAGLQYNFS